MKNGQAVSFAFFSGEYSFFTYNVLCVHVYMTVITRKNKTESLVASFCSDILFRIVSRNHCL